MKMVISKRQSNGLFAVLLGLLSTSAAHGDAIFVVNPFAGKIGEYTTSGATVNASLISGLSIPSGIAVSGSDLFVVNEGTGTIGEYTTSGATVNASLISGLTFFSGFAGIAVSGSDLFVSNQGAGTDRRIHHLGRHGERFAGLGVKLPCWHCGVRIGSVCRELPTAR